jgi:uncharacterized protein YcaQ
MLDGGRPPDLLEVMTRLTFLQLDPTAAVAPSADLVAYSRMGAAYRPEHLRQAMETHRTAFEHRLMDPKAPALAVVRPMSDLGLYLAQMRTMPRYARTREWLAANDAFRRNVLDVLEKSGPRLSRDIPDTSALPWASTGWSNDRNVTQMLEILLLRGEVAVSGRRGKQRVWDLASRVYPQVKALALDEALAIRQARSLQSLGIVRPKAVGNAGEPALVEGIDGEWRVDPAALGAAFLGRTVLLSPFDRLIHDRSRAQDLFGFDYVLEMYKPAAKRRWGFFALPILHEDRLIGKLDAVADRRAGTFQVNAVHQDIRFGKDMARAVAAETTSLASWLGLDVSGI